MINCFGNVMEVNVLYSEEKMYQLEAICRKYYANKVNEAEKGVV